MRAQIRRLYTPFTGVAIVANTIGTLVIFALVLIMNIDVIARGLFNAPLRGVVEVVIFSLILIVFLQLPDVVRSNRLTRSDGFLVLAETNFPRIGSWLSRAIDLAACIFMALIAWTIWPEAIESIETCGFISGPEFGGQVDGGLFARIAAAFGRCEYFGTPGIFTAPWWPAKMSIAFSVTLCAIIFLFKTILGNRNPALVDDGESPV
ncbi:TRAP transporter small permease subunit [Pseudahrensia aquimaris]|uniref:TRAP transporter small permease protein n=1 Tax=Pseudahrensia aquimaris TaxID=744461 RepID=A0ABW3F8S9_9HYPH